MLRFLLLVLNAAAVGFLIYRLLKIYEQPVSKPKKVEHLCRRNYSASAASHNDFWHIKTFARLPRHLPNGHPLFCVPVSFTGLDIGHL